jgi:hypothetical protein
MNGGRAGAAPTQEGGPASKEARASELISLPCNQGRHYIPKTAGTASVTLDEIPKRESRVYLLNSLIIPADLSESRLITMRRATVEEVKALLARGYTSAIGHDSTASLLSKLLGIPIPTNRISVKAEPGDVLIHFALKTRLPEGKVLTEEELKGLDFDLVISEVHSHIVCKSCQELVYP